VVVPSLDLIFKPEDLNMNVDQVYQIALANQPSIKAADYQSQSAEKGLSIARGKLYPTLNLFGQFSTNYSNLYQTLGSLDTTDVYTVVGKVLTTNDPVGTPVIIPHFNSVGLFDQYNDNFGKAFGVTLDVPIFNGWQARTNVSRSKIQVMQSQLNLEEVKQNLLKSVQSAYINAVAGRKQYEATLNEVNSFQRAFDDAKVRFSAGAINSVDYTTAETNLFKAQNDLVQAKYQYIFKLKVLDFYEGKPLTIE
jgi:outer membrane protein